MQTILTPTPLATIDPTPVLAWRRDVDDAWLREQMGAWLDDGVDDAWSVAVAAGLYARLRPLPRGEAATAAVERLLAGEVDVIEGRAWTWARALTPAQVETLRDLLVAACSSMTADLVALADEVDDDGLIRVAFHRRDDLACVIALLAERGAMTGLWPLVRRVDVVGRGVLVALSTPRLRRVLGDDERLFRALALTPDAWWAAAVADRVVV